MSELMINTKMAFQILNLITKLELKKPLINIINKQCGFQSIKESLFKELNERSKYDGEITGEVITKLLNDNLDIAEKLSNIENDIRSESLNFIFEIIEKIPMAENEFYKTLSIVTGEKIKDIEKKDISEVVEIITSIFISKSFMGLLNVMTR
mgnify:CR=1 FL=1